MSDRTTRRPRRRLLPRILGLLLLCAGCMGLGAVLTLLWVGRPVEQPSPTAVGTEHFEQAEQVEESRAPTAPEAPMLAFPAEREGREGALYVSEAREGYQSGELRLIIPKLSIESSLYNGTEAATLSKGECLYEYAQLPSEENGNVSIAGHRNGIANGRPTDSRPFYYLNTLTEGDLLYLTDDEHIYKYLWESTRIVSEEDWGPIRNTGYSCVTLTTCTPITTQLTDKRLIVRGRLVETLPLTEDYPFPANAER